MRRDVTVGDRHLTVAGGRVELRCPDCHGRLVHFCDQLRCHMCRRTYSIVRGVPVLTALIAEDVETDYKLRQVEFFDGEGAEFEITRPHGQPMLYGWLMVDKFRRSIRGVESRLLGATLLTVCGGSGMDAEFLSRQRATVVASDISLGAVERARERAERGGLEIDPLVADAEHLPFSDGAFEIVYVHDGLHHLSNPIVGLSEMCRVARGYVLLSEPCHALVTEIAIRLGIALTVEDAGNRVERLSLAQVRDCLNDHGFDIVGADRYGMYYRHKPNWAMRFFSRRRAFRLARLSVGMFNRSLGSVGNKLSVRAVRRPNDRGCK